MTRLELSAYDVAIGGKNVVRNIGLRLEGGIVTAVLGPNGAGKSTFMKGLCGLRKARGQALLDGADLLTMPPSARANLVGYVAQDTSHLSVRLSVFELLMLAQNGGRHSWRATPQSGRRAENILAVLGLERFTHATPAGLSGGERQMIALALALVRQPKLLLLDEPTSALDLANQLHMLDVVQKYTREHGIVTITILHDLNLATRYADLALLLDQGEEISKGPTREILTVEQLARLYRVECRMVDVDNGAYSAIYPLAVIPAVSG
ncbi:ABC transporter ATP-binding protein [Agrobacterium sp. NPDC089420]|uniref:ABC transporter ATP-binding protein n=1 Tax=Agrobacterium sp. NPDC089420 TaxID=3363918 RepID=UPI0038501938